MRPPFEYTDEDQALVNQVSAEMSRSLIDVATQSFIERGMANDTSEKGVNIFIECHLVAIARVIDALVQLGADEEIVMGAVRRHMRCLVASATQEAN